MASVKMKISFSKRYTLAWGLLVTHSFLRVHIGREVTILELKRCLDMEMVVMRKRKRVTARMDLVFDYIEMNLRKDLAQR